MPGRIVLALAAYACVIERRKAALSGLNGSSSYLGDTKPMCNCDRAHVHCLCCGFAGKHLPLSLPTCGRCRQCVPSRRPCQLTFQTSQCRSDRGWCMRRVALFMWPSTFERQHNLVCGFILLRPCHWQFDTSVEPTTCSILSRHMYNDCVTNASGHSPSQPLPPEKLIICMG
jgi:hypothetical protein